MVWEDTEKCDYRGEPEDGDETHTTASGSSDKKIYDSRHHSDEPTFSICHSTHSESETPIYYPRNNQWEKKKHHPRKSDIEVCEVRTLVIGSDILNIRVTIPKETSDHKR